MPRLAIAPLGFAEISKKLAKIPKSLLKSKLHLLKFTQVTMDLLSVAKVARTMRTLCIATRYVFTW